jgi:D-aminopeptidase
VPPISVAAAFEHSESGGKPCRIARYLYGGASSIQISSGPRVTVHARSVEVDVISHVAWSTPASCASAACARSRKLGELLHGAVKKSVAAAATTLPAAPVRGWKRPTDASVAANVSAARSNASSGPRVRRRKKESTEAKCRS